MTQTNTIKEKEYEYSYQDSNLTNAHSFLMKPLLSMLPKSTNLEGKKLKLLDLGCGNGSLSHVMAQQGFEIARYMANLFLIKINFKILC
jgi:2-polyprenyl-3-methyl-5-hydroxy-6-metoxy-1,4-benzoquinol methylase